MSHCPAGRSRFLGWQPGKLSWSQLTVGTIRGLVLEQQRDQQLGKSTGWTIYHQHRRQYKLLLLMCYKVKDTWQTTEQKTEAWQTDRQTDRQMAVVLPQAVVRQVSSIYQHRHTVHLLPWLPTPRCPSGCEETESVLAWQGPLCIQWNTACNTRQHAAHLSQTWYLPFILLIITIIM